MKHDLYDVVGIWSEIKLAIIREYAAAYCSILSAQKNPTFSFVYVDAFAGAGISKSKRSGKFIPGSPLNALRLEPGFSEYHFIDLDGRRVALLERVQRMVQDKRINVHHGDSNAVLLRDIFPFLKYEDYRRALCLLDPYGLHLDWRVILQAAQLKTVELFINFPIMDVNRNVLRPRASASDVNRMNNFWGDEAWKQELLRPKQQLGLFEEEDGQSKADNKRIAESFRERLRRVAGFKYVPDPIPMRNSTGAIVYYLFFAAHKAAAKEIVEDIFAKYRKLGEVGNVSDIEDAHAAGWVGGGTGQPPNRMV